MRPTNTRPPEACLEDMIARHMATPGCVTAPDTRADFVMSGIRAACAATPVVRRKILADLASIMNCRPDDLSFLFANLDMQATGSRPYELMVPDFQQKLMAAAE